MKTENINEARKTPMEITDLVLSPHSTDKYEEYNCDYSSLGDDIGKITIFKNLISLEIREFAPSQTLIDQISKLHKLKSLTLW